MHRRFWTRALAPACALLLLLAACDGGSPVSKRPDGVYATARPTITPDGRRILFAAVRGGQSALYSMDLEGGDLLPLLSRPDADLHSPLHSPDGTKVCFVMSAGDETRGRIAMANQDGTGLTVVSAHPGALDRSPVLTPDGRSLVVQRSEGLAVTQQFWRIDLVTREERLLSPDEFWHPTPHSILPDGQRLLFAQMEKITWQETSTIKNQIYLMEMATGKLERLGPPGRTYPCLTPKGDGILFLGEGGKGNVIYLAARDGSHPRELYGSSLGIEGLTLSPDGRRAVFLQQQSLYNKRYDILTLHLVTGDLHRLQPDWSTLPAQPKRR